MFSIILSGGEEGAPGSCHNKIILICWNASTYLARIKFVIKLIYILFQLASQ